MSPDGNMEEDRESPCFLPPDPQDATGHVATRSGLSSLRRPTPADLADARKCLARVIARRAVEILREEEGR